MTTLYVLRHGIAVPHGTPDYPDSERPLTAQGRARVREVARGFGRLGLTLDRILTSPLPRALETARIVAETLGRESDLEEAIELSADRTAEQVAEWLRELSVGRLMIVGHNPALSDLLGLLTVGKVVEGFCELRRGG